MSKMQLRKQIRISYYKPEEPSFDEYIYCDRCRAFVYDYCSIHGPLLVIADDEVVEATNPPYVPRAALTVPKEFLHIAPSIIPGAGLGVFATMTLPRGVRFGPYQGQRTKHISSQYCWKIQDLDLRHRQAVDASDARVSNWMRYVNCARHWHEQNLVAYQYRGEIYYRTIKIIPRFTELMVFYGSEFAVALDIDLKNYNSEEFCQKIVQTKLNTAPQVYGRPNYFIENTPTEDSNHSTHEEINNNDLYTSTKVNFVIIDSPEDSMHSDTHRFDSNPNCVDTKMYETIPSSKNEVTCPICNKTLSSQLQRHIKTMHGTKKKVLPKKNKKKSTFSCHICQKTYKQKRCLRDHLKTHANPDLYKCNICEKMLSDKHKLKQHILIHTMPQFECDKCSFKSTSTYCFNRHIQTHTTKLYECNDCLFYTSSRYNIVRHVRRHL